MSRTAMPTVEELGRFLEAAGLIESPPTDEEEKHDLELALSAAKEAFEHDTGHEPFMAAAAVSDRKFNPSYSRFLELDTGIATATGVVLKIGVTDVYAGTSLTVDRDYFLGPANAETKGKPFSYIERRRGAIWYGITNSIVVTARWGFSATVPEDVFSALLAAASVLLIPGVGAALSGGLKSVTLGYSSFNFGGQDSLAFGPSADKWVAQYERTVGRYRRLAM